MNKIITTLLFILIIQSSYCQSYRSTNWDTKLLSDNLKISQSDWQRAQDQKAKELKKLITKGNINEIQNFLDNSGYSFSYNYKYENPFSQAIHLKNEEILHVLCMNHNFTWNEMEEYTKIANGKSNFEITDIPAFQKNYFAYADTLFDAIQSFNYNYIDDYVSRGKNINFKTQYGENGFHILLKKIGKEKPENLTEYEKMISFLIERNMNCAVREEENNGQMPLYFAVKYGSGKMVKELHDACPTVYFDTIQLVVNAMHNKDTSVLDEIGDFIDLKKVEIPNKRNLLHYAVKSNLTHQIPVLIKKRVNPNQQDEYGIIPLALDIENIKHDKNLIDLLTNTKVNIPMNNHETCLTLAVRKNGNESTVELLINNGANVNYQAQRENIFINPIFLALENENKNYLEILIRHQADLNIKNLNGETPLKFAKTKAKEYKKQYGVSSKELEEITQLLSNN